MNAVQEKYNQLLIELTEYCDQNGIEYRLHGQTAKMAYLAQGYVGRIIETKIEMTVSQVRKLISAMERLPVPGRSLDYMGKRKDYPGFSLRYSDPSTLYLPLNQCGSYVDGGMGVEIIILRKYPSAAKKRLILQGIEGGYEINYSFFGFRAYPKRFLCGLILRFLNVLLGKKRVGKWLFEWLLDQYDSNEEDRLCVWRPFGKLIVLPKNDGVPVDWIPFEDKAYPVCGNTPLYLKSLYKTKWNKGNADGISPGQELIVDPNLNYEELWKALEENGFSMKSYMKEHRKVKQGISKRAPYYRQKMFYWKKAMNVGNALESETYYEQCHEYTQNLIDNFAFEKLERHMKRYKTILSQKNGFFYSASLDQELIDPYIALLEVRGKTTEARRYKRLKEREGYGR